MVKKDKLSSAPTSIVSNAETNATSRTHVLMAMSRLYYLTLLPFRAGADLEQLQHFTTTYATRRMGTALDIISSDSLVPRLASGMVSMLSLDWPLLLRFLDGAYIIRAEASLALIHDQKVATIPETGPL